MFDIGSIELLVVAVVALLVLGPERLPVVLRTMGLWIGRLRRSFSAIKTEIENEIGMDDIRRQLHNEAVLDEIKRIEDEVHGNPENPATSTAETNPQNANDPATANSIASEPPAPESAASESAASGSSTPGSSTPASTAKESP